MTFKWEPILIAQDVFGEVFLFERNHVFTLKWRYILRCLAEILRPLTRTCISQTRTNPTPNVCSPTAYRSEATLRHKKWHKCFNVALWNRVSLKLKRQTLRVGCAAVNAVKWELVKGRVFRVRRCMYTKWWPDRLVFPTGRSPSVDIHRRAGRRRHFIHNPAHVTGHVHDPLLVHQDERMLLQEQHKYSNTNTRSEHEPRFQL